MKETIMNEIIGLGTEVTDSKNKSNIGIKGKIVDETKNTITVNTKNGKKLLLKKNITIKIKEKTIKGELLLRRPEDRIKKR